MIPSAPPDDAECSGGSRTATINQTPSSQFIIENHGNHSSKGCMNPLRLASLAASPFCVAKGGGCARSSADDAECSRGGSADGES